MISVVKYIAILALCVSIAVLPACQTGVGVTTEQIDELARNIEDIRNDLKQLPEESPGRVAAEQKIDELQKLVAAYKTRLEQMIADGAANPDATIAAGIQTAAPLLPPPWNVLLLVAGGLLPGVAAWARESARRRQAVQAGQDLARAVKSAAIAHGGVVDFRDVVVRETLKAAMPDRAREIVKQAGATVPFPAAAKTDVASPVVHT